MAIKLKYINSLFFTDNYTVNLGFKEKLIYVYLILNQEVGGIIKINIGELTENLNSKEMLDNADDLGDYDEASIISRKDIVNALKKLIEDGKLIKMTDGYYLLTRSFKNQNIQNCYHMTGVINQLSKKLEGFPWMLEYMKSSSDYFGQMLTLVIEQLEKPKSKTSTQEKSDSYKVSLKSKFIEFCELNKIDLIKLLNSYNIEQQELWHTYQIPTRHLSDRYRHNSNSNNNININHNYNPNPKDKDYKDDNIKKVKNKNKEINVESSKNPSLGGQVFEDSSPEAKLSARVKKKKKEEEEETREERKARKQKERKDACDLALALMKTYKGVELRRKLKKVLQPYEPEEYDQVMETPRARYWNIPAKQYYFSERSIPDAQIEQAERVVEKVNEYVMDNFDADEQIPDLNPLCSETVYKILNDYFQRPEDAFLEELFSHFDKLKEEGTLHKIRNLDMHIYAFGTNVPIDDLLNKDLL